jgi:hypothetical protein
MLREGIVERLLDRKLIRRGRAGSGNEEPADQLSRQLSRDAPEA